MKTLIIEDDPEIIETIFLIMKIRWPDCVMVSESTGKRGLELAEIEDPDLVIIDLGLPDMSGFDVLRQIRTFSKTPIIIVTVRGEEADIVKGLELGADDYMVKPFGQMELLARAQAVIRRSLPGIDENPITLGGMRFSPSFGKISFNGRDIALTNIEGLILYQLMNNPGVVLNYTTLAEKIWGDYYPGAVNSLRVYIRHLRSKLEVDPYHPRFILTKVGVGYFINKLN
jgi:two-component system response regulator VicR